MDEYVSKGTLYNLCQPTGVFRLHVSHIDQMPPTDVAPVVHGRWEHAHASESYFNECWRCSECGFDDTEGFGFEYCPNCGAKMDGGKA